MRVPAGRLRALADAAESAARHTRRTPLAGTTVSTGDGFGCTAEGRRLAACALGFETRLAGRRDTRAERLDRLAAALLAAESDLGAVHDATCDALHALRRRLTRLGDGS